MGFVCMLLIWKGGNALLAEVVASGKLSISLKWLALLFGNIVSL